MVLELKKGYYIESNYDKFTDSYITRLLDENGKQVRDALYSADIVDRNYDIQSIKDFFKTYMNDPNFNISDKEKQEEKVDDEFAEEISDEDFLSEIESSEEPIEEAFNPEIEKKARRTKKATKKAKLPALSKLSPIMPDPAKSINNFNAMQADGNSGLGSTTGSTSLGEEFLDRDTLIRRLKDMGFKYKFDKYSDKQLYRIYQERTKAAKKKEAEKREQQKASDLADHKRENSRDSYFRDGIEFESEDAAREYFGESMNTFEDTARVRDITAWAFSKDLDLDTTVKVVERQMKKEGSIIPNNLRSIVYACWDDLSDDYDNKYFGESMSRPYHWNVDEIERIILKAWEDAGLRLRRDRIHVSRHDNWCFVEIVYIDDWTFKHINKAWIKKTLKKELDLSEIKQSSWKETGWGSSDYGKTLRYDMYVSDEQGMNESMDNKFYLNDMHKAWDMIDPEDEVSIPTTHSKLTESLTEARKPKYLNTRFAEKVKQDMKSGKLTYHNIKEWDKEQNGGVEPNPPFNTRELMNYFKDTMNESHRFKTIAEGLKFFEHKHFDESCEDIQLESLFESMRDKLSSDDIKKLGAFMNHAEDPDEVITYMKGLLSEDLDSDKLSTQDLYSLANECINVAVSNNVWNVDIADVENFGGVAVITFIVKGDWKHDHIHFNLIAKEFFGENIKFPFDVYEYEADENGDYDSDYYPAYHVVEIQLEESSNNPMVLELKESLNEAFTGSIEDINVDEIVPQQKDYDRAKGLQFKGRSFRGDGQPWGSEASKMAKLIKDPIKLVRRAKAVAAVYGADEGYMSNTGYYHHVSPDAETDVWGPFKKRLIEFGFTNDQIGSISNFKLTESLNEDWESSDPSIAEMIAEDILIGAEEEYGINASLYNIDFDEDSNTADIAISVEGFDGFMEFIENYFKPPIPKEIDKLINIYEDEVGDNEIIYTLVIKFKNKSSNVDINNLVDELISQLSQVGFIIDKNSSGITNNMMGGKHLQVINPDMPYPTSETEGEDITEEEAYRLFVDDLKEVTQVLDEIENKYPYVSITFNFGVNKDNIVTGGIDIRMLNGRK